MRILLTLVCWILTLAVSADSIIQAEMPTSTVLVDSISISDSSAATSDTLFAADSALLIPLPEIDEIKFRKRQPNRWIFFITCAIFILFGFNRILNIKRHDQLLFGSLSGKSFKSNEAVFRELSVHQILAVLIIAFTGGIALLLWLPVPFGHIFQSTLSQYIFWVSVVIFIYTLKAFSYYLVIAILQIRDLSDLLFSQFIMITYSLFLIWLPILLIWNYNSDESLHLTLGWTALVAASAIFILRFVRTVQAMSKAFPYSEFYLFLYLCCLEILPWAIIAKVYSVWAL